MARGKQHLTDPEWRLEEDRLHFLAVLAAEYPDRFTDPDPWRIWPALGQTGEPPGWFEETIAHYCGGCHNPAEVLAMYTRLEPTSGFLRAPVLPPLEPLPNETEEAFLEWARKYFREWREAHLKAGAVVDEWPQRLEHLRWLAWNLVEGLGAGRIAERLAERGEAVLDVRSVERALAKARERLKL